MTNQALYATGLRLWNEWTEMWNLNQPERAAALVAERFVLHLPEPLSYEVRDAAGVARWVSTHRASYRRLTFHVGCGPFVDITAGVVAGPWFAEASTDGTPRVVCGMDTIAFRDGRIIEYWTLSRPVPAVGDWAVFHSHRR